MRRVVLVLAAQRLHVPLSSGGSCPRPSPAAVLRSWRSCRGSGGAPAPYSAGESLHRLGSSPKKAPPRSAPPCGGNSDSPSRFSAGTDFRWRQAPPRRLLLTSKLKRGKAFSLRQARTNSCILRRRQSCTNLCQRTCIRHRKASTVPMGRANAVGPAGGRANCPDGLHRNVTAS